MTVKYRIQYPDKFKKLFTDNGYTLNSFCTTFGTLSHSTLGRVCKSGVMTEKTARKIADGLEMDMFEDVLQACGAKPLDEPYILTLRGIEIAFAEAPKNDLDAAYEAVTALSSYIHEKVPLSADIPEKKKHGGKKRKKGKKHKKGKK